MTIFQIETKLVIAACKKSDSRAALAGANTIGPTITLRYKAASAWQAVPTVAIPGQYRTVAPGG
jgi:hypothetical protein